MSKVRFFLAFFFIQIKENKEFETFLKGVDDWVINLYNGLNLFKGEIKWHTITMNHLILLVNTY